MFALYTMLIAVKCRTACLATGLAVDKLGSDCLTGAITVRPATVVRCEHGLCCWYEDVVPRVSHHFFCHVSVSDTALCCCHVFSGYAEVVVGVFQSVLDRAEVTSCGGYAVDCVFNLADCCLRTCLCADVYIRDT